MQLISRAVAESGYVRRVAVVKELVKNEVITREELSQWLFEENRYTSFENCEVSERNELALRKTRNLYELLRN